MASPVITAVTVLYPGGQNYKLPGQAAELFVDALDADAKTITVQVTVADAAGATVQSTGLVVQSDPLTYSATTIAGHTVTQDPSQLNKFFVV